VRYILPLLLLLLLPSPSHAESSRPPSSDQPALIGHLSLSAASEGLNLGSGDAPTCLAVEAGLRFQRVLGDLSLTVDGCHYADDACYWLNKSQFGVGLDIPLGRDAVLFGRFERRYRVGDEWTRCGIRFSFSSSSY
jgi:hypothetical protein